jgi:transposase-like protein
MQSDRDEAIYAVLQGVPVEAVAKELGVSEPTVYRWMREGGHSKQVRNLRDRKVIHDYEHSDKGVHAICGDHDISIATLYRILHDNNVELRKPTRTEEDDDLVVELYKDGETVINIRRITERSFTTIYTILEERGVRLRNYSRRRGE